MFCFSEVWRSSVVSYYTRTYRTIDPPRLESPHGASSSAQSKVSAGIRPGCSGLCQVDNTLRDRDSTTLPLQLLQCFITLTVSTFIVSCWNLPIHIIAVVSWCSSAQSLAQAPLWPPHGGWQMALQPSQSLLFCWLNQPSSLSLSV